MGTVGTSQNQRGSPALQPGWLAIDGRSPRQLLAATPRLARLFNYYDETNRRSGQWDAFFESEPLIEYAGVAEIDLTAQQRLFSTNLQGLGDTMERESLGDQAAAWTVIDRLNFLYRRFDRAAILFTALPAESEYAGMVRQAINGPLRHARARMLECRSWLIANSRYPFEEAGWPGAWPDAMTEVRSPAWLPDPPSEDPASLTPTTFVAVLSKATWTTHSTVVQLVTAAAGWFSTRFVEPTGLRPHFALYLAFIRQFGRAQAVMNRIPYRHCDYFYREVLKLENRGIVPDSAFVSFTAAPGAWVDLPAGTLVSAGKDPNGLPIAYATAAEVTVTAATVAKFATIYLAKATKGFTGFYVAPAANSADGNGAALPPGASWATFGEEQAKLPPPRRTMNDAQIGFAVSSPVLYLESGTRQIELVVAYSRPSGKIDLVSNPQPPLPIVPGTLEYSGPKGWVTVPAAQTSCALHYVTEDDGAVVALNVTYNVTLAASDPACVNYDPKTLGPGYDSRVPVLRVRFVNPLEAFPTANDKIRHAFLQGKVASAAVRVAVTGLLPDVLAGPTGTLPAAKPMPLFGAPVQPAAAFLVGAVELFRKRPLTLTLSLDWIGLPTDANGLSDYFSDYLIAFDNPPPTTFRNDQYRVLWSALFDCTWVRIDRAAAPTPPQPDGEYLFAWTSPDAVTPPVSGKLASSSAWTASVEALAAWQPNPEFAGPLLPGTNQPTGYLQLTLAAPDHLFGQPIYATVVSDIALANALAIARATKPPPPPKLPSSYSLAAAYKILVIPAPPSRFFQRVGQFLHLSDTASAKFKPTVLPAVTAAGTFSPELKATTLAAWKHPDELYTAVVNMLTKPPTFTDLDSFTKAVASTLDLHPIWPSQEELRDEIIGWMASLVDKPAPVPPPDLKPLPKPPLVPTATNVRLAYTAETIVDLKANAANPPAAWDRMWHISPFVVSEMNADQPLLPEVAEGGTLFLGIAAAQVPQTLSLLFILEDLPIDDLPATLSDEPRWSYLIGDSWHAADAAIHRGTDGFLRTGLVRIDLTRKLNLAHTVMPSGYIWVKAEVRHPADHLRTIQVLPNAAVARWVPPEGITDEQVATHFAQPLPALSLASLAVPNPAIPAVVQPLPSMGGSPPETDEQFYQRVSERLRHKGRAVAARDYERILLEQFPTVFFARSIPLAKSVAAPIVRLLVLPVVKVPPAAPPPGFVPGDLAEMAAAVTRVAPLSTTVDVVNPQYERVEVTASVKFNTARSPDFYIQQLSSDLAAFISPWIYDQPNVEDPVLSFHVSDLSTFIRSRPYVLSLTHCSARVVDRASAGTVPSDVIAPSGPQALLIAAAQQMITAE